MSLVSAEFHAFVVLNLNYWTDSNLGHRWSNQFPSHPHQNYCMVIIDRLKMVINFICIFIPSDEREFYFIWNLNISNLHKGRSAACIQFDWVVLSRVFALKSLNCDSENGHLRQYCQLMMLESLHLAYYLIHWQTYYEPM